MKSEKNRFAGCVEQISAQPTYLEFITSRWLWAIPVRQLQYLILGGNPESDGKKTSPPDMLVLVFETRTVFLFGWRLEQLLDPLMQGRIRRIHAEKHLGALMIGEPWISEILVVSRDSTFPL